MRLVSCCLLGLFVVSVKCLPADLLYNYNLLDASSLPREDDVSSREIKLKVPVVYYGIQYDSIFVNSNGLLSFQTEIPHYINMEFPLDYPIIAPFYSNVDTRAAGVVSYYETTDHPTFLQRATENIHESFINAGNFQATSLFIVTWQGVGYFDQKSDKVNTYQVVIASNGADSFVELLYPENGIQWIQGTGDQSGLPDARAQAGFLSHDGKMLLLPGSGTEQVRNLVKWSNMGLEGQFIYKVDGETILEPDLHNEGTPSSCATTCHAQATCKNYDEGFCCECNQNYYGNGIFCVKKDVPLRVNGKINGKINGERLENLDLQSYIVMSDGRAYTAISKIPESIGFDIQSMQILGGIIGYLIAKPVKNATNGFQTTGGVFNHSATVTFANTGQKIRVKEKYVGLDVHDQLRLEADIQGEIPTLPADSKVNIDEYEEQYTLTNPGIIQSSSERTYSYTDVAGNEVVNRFTVEQSIVFDYCKFENNTNRDTWKLKVGRNFISYEAKEQIIRFGLSNKIFPLGDSDPCEEGRSKCGENSACVVDNDSYKCVCNPGFQNYYTESETICRDLNECQTGEHECDYNAQCINLVGSYTCQCNPGYEGNGRICDSARSCANVRCNADAECVEGNGAAQCRCMPGFSGDGQSCSPIADHSCHVANNCSPYGVCAIDRQTNNYYCACLPGYQGDGYRCFPSQATPTEPTPAATEYPTTTEGLRQTVPQDCDEYGSCSCPLGYERVNGTEYCSLATQEAITSEEFLNVPEVQCFNDTLCFCPNYYSYSNITQTCVLTNNTPISTKGSSNPYYSCNVINNCHRNATCQYISALESYACTCNEGFEGDGYTCEVEEISCNKLDNCSPRATCVYDENFGKSKCICNAGYEGDGITCNAIAKCASDVDCSQNERCSRTEYDTYECVCKYGYERDSRHSCVPNIENCGGARCVQNAVCLHDPEYDVFYCNCEAGYQGDGITECKPKPVGCDTLNNCGLYATCQYDQQAQNYVCKCNSGFFGNGFNCSAERSCLSDPQMCDPHASCLADPKRRYSCECNPGYIGNGTKCREIHRHEGNFLLVNQGMATLKIPMHQSRTNLGKPIQTKLYQTAVGLDIDCSEGRVYWSDLSKRTINSAFFNGSDKEIFIEEDIGSPEGLAIDWVSRNIYWTDSTKHTIEVASLDSKLRKVLINMNLENPRGIAVHPQRGKIFWSDWYRKDPKIEWANADGTGRQLFLKDQIGLPNSLSIDYQTESLCYADAGIKKVECINIDTREKKLIASNLTYPFGIAVTDNTVYWSDWISKKIERVDKLTMNKLTPLEVPLGGSGKLFGLAAVTNTCPRLSNDCQNPYTRCEENQICLPNGLGGKTCLCPYLGCDS